MSALRDAAAAVVAGLMLGPLPTLACTINLPSGGTLRNSADNTVLGSEVNGNTPATVTMLLPLLSGVTISVDAPSLVESPPGYNAGSETRQVAYEAAVLGLLHVQSQPYTSSPSNFGTGLLGAVTVTMTMHNRIINPAGFAAGNYRTRTVVTCHP